MARSRRTVAKGEAWRRVEPVHYDTGGGMLDTADWRGTEGLRLVPYGPEQWSVVERMWRGETCSRCSYRFPEPPTPQNYKRILAECGPFPVSEADATSRIMRRECPLCGYPLGDGIMRHQDEGAPPDQQLASRDAIRDQDRAAEEEAAWRRQKQQ